MRLAYWLVPIAAAGLMIAPVKAAPANTMRTVVQPGADSTSMVEKTAYRCWRRGGTRVCRWSRSGSPRSYGGYYAGYGYTYAGRVGVMLGIGY